MWTPTDQDGRLIESALAQNLAFLKRHGVNGLLALGSTGEFLRLEPEERRKVAEKVARICSPLRLMINISELRPTEVAEMGRFARGIGAEAVSLLPPYFYPLAQDDLVEFFVRAGEAAQLPLFLYNFPERTGNRIALETMPLWPSACRSQASNRAAVSLPITGRSSSSGGRQGFVVMTGADTRLPEAVAMGVDGCVSGLTNAVPDLVWPSLARHE